MRLLVLLAGLCRRRSATTAGRKGTLRRSVGSGNERRKRTRLKARARARKEKATKESRKAKVAAARRPKAVTRLVVPRRARATRTAKARRTRRRRRDSLAKGGHCLRAESPSRNTLPPQ